MDESHAKKERGIYQVILQLKFEFDSRNYNIHATTFQTFILGIFSIMHYTRKTPRRNFFARVFESRKQSGCLCKHCVCYGKGRKSLLYAAHQSKGHAFL